ncbi:serine hydrolase domain-containing protein [Longibacter sp.]|uniref:serine hydrolase domain-containing protein n=1 Tax=Longibacter sp. TaxID=2045415 RepID=UPI003EBFB2BC
MLRFFSTALLLLLTLLVGACSPPETSEERADVIASIVNQARSESDVPGASVAVVQDGEVVQQFNSGVADRASERPVTDATIFQLASATKIFAGTAVMMMVEERQLALDDSVHMHLPELPDAWRGVTIRQAMSHTSGLPSLIDPQTGDLVAGAMMTEAWQAVQQKPLQDTSTTTWRYNQTGFEIVRRVIQRVSGQSWESFAQDRIFAPAGMESTFFVGQPAPDSSRLATPYREEYEAFDFAEAYEYYIPTAAGLFSTAGDLARFAQALSAGELLAEESREQMWTSVPFDESTIDAIEGYGIGWTVDTQDGRRRVWHSGGGKAALMHYPDDDLTVILLTNRAGFDVVTPTTEIAALYLE